MSTNLEKYKGKLIKIKAKTEFVGKIYEIDKEVVVLTEVYVGGKKSHFEFVGVDVFFISDIEFVEEDYDESCVANVYSSEEKPPIIRRGGSSSAVCRNLGYQTNTINEGKKRCPSFSKQNSFRSRKSSLGYSSSVPSWMNYEINNEFDFDYNLALFDKQAFVSGNKYQKAKNENSDSSDSVGIKIHFDKKKNITDTSRRKYNQTFTFEPTDFTLLDSDDKTVPPLLNGFCVKSSDKVTNRDGLTNTSKRTIIPIDQRAAKNEKTKKNVGNITSHVSLTKKDSQNLTQPDIVREATKKQVDIKSIITVNGNSSEFNFSEFWKIDDLKYMPVFTNKQRNLLFDCARSMGHSTATVVDYVGQCLADFIIRSVNGSSKINIKYYNGAPKVAVLVGKCRPSVFGVSTARHLVNGGCHVLIYYDENYLNESDKLLEQEFNLLRKVLSMKLYKGFDIITYNYQDLNGYSFDYILSGLEDSSVMYSPDNGLIQWTLNQSTPIMCLDPMQTSQLKWDIGVFIGVPTVGPNDGLEVRVRLPENGKEGSFLRPRSDGLPGLEMDRWFGHPTGPVLVVDPGVPNFVYEKLGLTYLSPFSDISLVKLHSCQLDMVE